MESTPKLSKLFIVNEPEEKPNIPTPKKDNYTIEELSNMLRPIKHNDNIVIGIIEKYIENSGDSTFFIPVGKESAIICTQGLNKILQEKNLHLYNYLLLMIYRFVLLRKMNSDFIKTKIHHGDPKNCVFALCDCADDIKQILGSPCICTSCKNEIEKINTPFNLIKIACKELKTIRRPVFYIISDFIKIHPIFSILIGSGFTIFLNLLSNIFFEYLSNKFFF
jgi:hypothetical protein